MTLNIASIFIFFFIAFNLFFRSGFPLWLKIPGIAVLFLASMKFQVYRFIGGAFYAPVMDRRLILFLEAMFGAFIILFFLLLLYDIYLLGNWLLAKAGFPVPKRLPKGLIKGGLCLLALLLGGYGTWQAVKVPTPRDVELRIPNLPESLEGFSIAQLTDLHIGPILRKDWLEKVVEKTNALKPDMIVLTGDYVDGRVSEIGEELKPLADLRAPCGVFGVTGNHEYYWNAAEWTKAMEDLGVRMLSNEHTTVEAKGEKVIVAGIPDLMASRFGFPPPSLAEAMKNAPEGLRLLLSHRPGVFKKVETDIQLSGHTHGGIMFFAQPLVAEYNEGFVSGLYQENNKNLYVSPGTGLWNGFSCRIGVPSEITRIILRKGWHVRQRVDKKNLESRSPGA